MAKDKVFGKFLSSLGKAVSRGVKSKLATSYYTGGIAQLVGAIEAQFAGRSKMQVFLRMIEFLPDPDWATLSWLVTQHTYFNGKVRPTTQAIEKWLNVKYLPQNRPSYMYKKTDDPRQYVGAWGLAHFGKFVLCPEHGWQFCIRRYESKFEDHPTNGWWYREVVEELTCGCKTEIQEYSDCDPVRTFFQ